MAEYDETNRGAAFTPFPTQQMILQGKVNVEGVDSKVVLVKDQTKDGRGIVEVYQKMAVMFDNDKKGNEAAPDYTGPMGDTRRLAAWRKMKDDKPYMTFNVSDKQQNAGSVPSSNIDDKIPF